MSFHSRARDRHVHSTYFRTYLDATKRLADESINPLLQPVKGVDGTELNDIGKHAEQQSDDSIWKLKSVDPDDPQNNVWLQIGGPNVGGGQSPWQSDIDGAGFDLSGGGTITAKNNLPASSPTGIIAGDTPTPSATVGSIDISAMKLLFTDYTDSTNPVRTIVDLPVQTVANPLVATSTVTRIWVDIAGAVTFTDFTVLKDNREFVLIGNPLHFDNVNITDVKTSLKIEATNDSWLPIDLTDMIGLIKSGMPVAGRGADLGIDIGTGSVFLRNANQGDDPESRNILPYTATTVQPTLAHHLRSGQTIRFSNVLEPTLWDNNGTEDTVGNNNFTNIRIWIFPNGANDLFAIAQKGQQEYGNLVSAQSGAITDAYVLNPILADTDIGLAIISIREDATQTIPDGSTVAILNVGKFGFSDGGGGGPGGGPQTPWGSDIDGAGFNLDNVGDVDVDGRLNEAKGTNVASAASITLPAAGNSFDITGSITIDEIVATGWKAGSVIRLHFLADITVTHNAAVTDEIEFSNNQDHHASLGSDLTLLYTGTNWREITTSGVMGRSEIFWDPSGGGEFHVDAAIECDTLTSQGTVNVNVGNLILNDGAIFQTAGPGPSVFTRGLNVTDTTDGSIFNAPVDFNDDIRANENIIFTTAAVTAPITATAIYSTALGLNFNVPTGSEFSFQVNGVEEMELTATELNLRTNHVVDVANIRFASGVTPGATVPAIGWDDNQMFFNVPTGDEFDFFFNGVSAFVLKSDQLDVKGRDITNTGIVEFTVGTGPSPTVPAIFHEASRTAYNTPAATAHEFTINGVSKMRVTTANLDLQQNDLRNVTEITLAENFNTDKFNGKIFLGGEHFIAWDTADDGDNHSIGFPGDVFTIGFNGSFVEFTLSQANGADFQGNDVAGIGLLKLLKANNTAVIELEADHTTPANGQVVGQIDFIDDDSGGNRLIYGQITTVIDDPTNGNEDGEMIIRVVEATTLTPYITLNEASSGEIAFKKDVNFSGFMNFKELPSAPATPATTEARVYVKANGSASDLYILDDTAVERVLLTDKWESNVDAGSNDLTDMARLVFASSAAPAATTPAIWWDTSEMNFNVPTGDLFNFEINGTARMTVSLGLVEFHGSTLEQINRLQFNTANPATAGEIRLSDTERIAWRNQGNTDNHSIAFVGDLFKIAHNDVDQYIFTDAFFDVNGNNVINANFYGTIDPFVATAGEYRMGVIESVGWRNNANTANLLLGIDATNALNFDGGHFHLKNTNALSSLVLEADHTTPANGDVVGDIDFVDDNSAGVTETYGRIRTTIESATDTTEEGEMVFSVIEGGAITNYLSLNLLGLNQVSVQKTLNLSGNVLFFVDNIQFSAANPATVGQIRFSVGDDVAWRNNANDGDLLLSVNASDELTFDGAVVNTAFAVGTQIAQYTNTDTTTNLNTGSVVEVPIMGTQEFLDSDFSVNGNGIQCDFAGRVEVTGNLYCTSAGLRVKLEIGIRINGTKVNGGTTQIYIRNNTGGDRGGSSLTKIMTVTSGQTITLQALRIGSITDSTTMLANESFLTVKRLT